MSKEMEEVLGEIGKGIKEIGQGSVEMKAGLQTLEQRIDKIEAKWDRESSTRHTSPTHSIAKMLAESAGYQEVLEAGGELQRGRNIRLLKGVSVKNTITSTLGETGSPSLGYPVVANRFGEVSGIPLRPLKLLSYVPLENISGATAQDIVRVSSETDGAATQAGEGSTKSESSYGFALKQNKIHTVAHFVDASMQVLSDAPALERFIRDVLIHRARQKLESLILSGNGTSHQPEGFIEVAPMLDTAGPTAIDRIGELLTAIEMADYVPDAIVIHPRPWDSIRRTKDADGNYLVGTFQGTPQPRVWGVPVIVTRSCPENRILAGAFQTQSAVLERDGFTVEASRHDGNNFKQNLVTLLCEGRYGLRINDPRAFRQVSIGGSP